MFVLLVELETDKERSNELEMVLLSLVAFAASEPGILFYAAQRPQDNSDRFILYEYYENKAAFEPKYGRTYEKYRFEKVFLIRYLFD